MKIKLLILTLLISSLSFAQYTAIPDANFENALSAYDDIPNDGQVPTANISGLLFLPIANKNISDLTGIQDFTALQNLVCGNNQLTSLDVSQNIALLYLLCYNNQLTSLDVSQNTSLIELSCTNNQLSSLDVSQNSTLQHLNCENNQLSSLDVSQNTVLQTLSCNDNQISNLDVSQNMALHSIHCEDNQLNNLTVVGATNLIILHCFNNQLSNLDISQNSVLQYLYCNDNLISSLNVFQNSALRYLYCNNNLISNLDVSQNTYLQHLVCDNNHLISLDVKNGNNTNINNFRATNNPNLTCIEVDNPSYSTASYYWIIDTQSSFSLNCHYNETYVPDDNFENYLETHNASGTTVAVGDPISMGNGIANDDYVTTTSINTVTNLDVNSLNIADLTGIEDFAALQNLDCRINSLTTLNITQNNNLLVLTAHDNQLNSLDLSGNIQLTGLGVFNNGLTSIDLSNNPLLTSLGLADNALTTLDLTNNTSVQFFQCENNQITNLDVSMISTLKTLYCFNNQLTILNVKSGNNTNITSFQFRSYGNPNLTCIIVDDATYSTTNWTNIDPASTFVNSQAACDALALDDVAFEQSIQVYPNPTKNQVTIKIDRISNYKIYNITGQIIKKGKLTNGENNLNVNNLNQGVYFIKITDNHSEITKKLIIK